MNGQLVVVAEQAINHLVALDGGFGLKGFTDNNHFKVRLSIGRGIVQVTFVDDFQHTG